MPEQAHLLSASSTNGFYPFILFRLVGGFYGMHITIFMKQLEGSV